MALHTAPMSISVEEHSYHTISSTVPMGGLPPGADHIAVLILLLAPSCMYPEYTLRDLLRISTYTSCYLAQWSGDVPRSKYIEGCQ